MKSKILSYCAIVFLFISADMSGAQSVYNDTYEEERMPGPVVNRELTESEMSFPKGVNNVIFNTERAVRVDFPAPLKKPVIQWSRLVDHIIPYYFIVGSKGCTWFFCSPSFHAGIIDKNKDLRLDQSDGWKTLVKLNPDGTLSWKKEFYHSHEYLPVTVLDGAIIITVTKWNFTSYNPEDATTVPEYIIASILEPFRKDDPLHDVSLECIDYAGKTVWRTRKAKTSADYIFKPYISQISGNRLMVSVGKFNSGKFNIYSLSNGALIKRMAFPKWYDGESLFMPIEIPQKGWIGFQSDGIVFFDLKFKSGWKFNMAIDELKSEPVVLKKKNMLIFGSANNLTALNLDTGKIIWQKTGYINAETWGSTDDIVIFTAFLSLENKAVIGTIDSDGNVIFTKPFKKESQNPFRQPHGLTIYNDGSLLMPKKNGMVLVDKKGSLIWSLDLEDAGFDSKIFSLQGNLYPTRDSRIVFFINNIVHYCPVKTR